MGSTERLALILLVCSGIDSFFLRTGVQTTMPSQFRQMKFNKGRASLGILLVTALFGVAGLISAPNSPFNPNSKASYLSEKDAQFIRPGLVLKVVSASIADNGTITARVRFADPKDVPLDRLGIETPGAVSGSIVAAYIPKGQTQYVAYTTRVQTSPITNKSATQAGADSGGVWTKVADGEYNYVLNTKAPTGFDKSATHAVGVYGNRNLTEFGLGVYLSDNVFTWVPDKSVAPVTRDVIKTSSCKRCHVDTFAFHGTTGRTSMEMCVLCHTPQTIDPDTGNSVDLPVMIHKIHMGKDLPSVKAGTPYQIIGNAQSMNDFSDVSFPTDKGNCTVCHEQTTKAAQATNYQTKPTRAACGACHDNVNFPTGENHAKLPQISDNQCNTCHQASTGNEFDISIAGAHTMPYNSKELTGFDWAITKVDDALPGKAPSVTFTLKDSKGNPLALTDMSRIFGVLGGPTTDYTTKWPGSTTNGYVSEDLSKATGSNGTYTYAFKNVLPATANGTFSISLDGRRVETIYAKTTIEKKVQYGPKKNAVMYFSVDGSKVAPRRTIVAIAKCQQCHVSLRLHGENRVDTIEHCVVCHNPTENDGVYRPKTAGAVNSVSFQQMIHNIHGGAETKAAYGNEDYVVYGYGGSTNNFSDVGFPGRLQSCSMCHVNNSQQLPLPDTNAQVQDPRGYIPVVGPATAACLSCHRGKSVAAHALTMTSSSLGESCDACHGPNSDYSVSKIHALP
jgi:OmcA/MtrC family decaheme c-type cytochrome